MSLEHERALAALARAQDGLFHRDDVCRAGLALHVLDRRVASGVLVERQPDVYQAATAPYDEPERARAALLAAGPLAMLSHGSAALRWELGSPSPERVWITLPFRCRLPELERVEVVRSRHTEGIRRTRKGFAVTSPARTWVDLGRVLGEEAMDAALATAFQRKLITLPEIDAVLAVAHHRAGTGVARAALVHFRPEWESVLSAKFGRLIEDAGITLEAGWVIRDSDTGEPIAVLDFADPRLRLAIEVDGWAYHGSKLQQQRDKLRDRRLLRLGWRTVRFTTEDVLFRPEQIVAELRALLAVAA
ncbi:MAG: DUF559 domain-containing protein [Mycobacteriales bacterium]